MTEPLSAADLAKCRDAIAAYEAHPDLGFACCSAHGAADAAVVLLAEVERQLEAAIAKAAPSAHDRQQQLLAAVRRQGGEWTPERAKALYRRLGHRVARAVIRGDLAALCLSGHLVLNDAPGRRFYTPAKDGVQ